MANYDVSWYTKNTSAETFEISTAKQLAGLAEIVNGTAEGIGRDGFRGKIVKLISDIDLSDYMAGDGWVPIGNYSTANAEDNQNMFFGTFNGNDHCIKNLTIQRPDDDYQGLFGYIKSGLVENIVLENVNILGGSAVGAVVGFLGGRARIVRHTVIGKIRGTRIDIGDVFGGYVP